MAEEKGARSVQNKVVSRGKQETLNLATDIYKTKEGEKPEDIVARRGYRLMNKLGAGAFATVLKAVRIDDNFVLACKIIEIKRKKRERLTDLKNELHVLEKVDHINIVKLYEHFLIDEKVYIFMEFAPGGTLSEYVRKKGPVKERRSKKWFIEISSAIQHLHRLNISHRDLKLGNILLDANSHCKVTDFGLSRVSYKPNKGVLYCTSCCGTEPYMAPEILKKRSDGTRLYDPMIADIWALGVCLYAMVNKAYPFNPEDKELMISNQLHRKWKFVRKQRNKLSLELKDLVRHMLEPNPRKRITMLGIMQHPWIKESEYQTEGTSEESSSGKTTKTETTRTMEGKTSTARILKVGERSSTVHVVNTETGEKFKPKKYKKDRDYDDSMDVGQLGEEKEVNREIDQIDELDNNHLPASSKTFKKIPLSRQPKTSLIRVKKENKNINSKDTFKMARVGKKIIDSKKSDFKGSSFNLI